MKISNVENKILDVKNFVTTTVLNTNIEEVKNLIPDVSGLVKKTDYNVISVIEKKNLLLEYNKFTEEKLDAMIKEKELADKSDIFNLIKNPDLYRKLETLATKAELKEYQDKIVKYKAFDSSHFHGKSHFEDDAAHNYLVFQPVHRYFKTVANTSEVSVWKSK